MQIESKQSLHTTALFIGKQICFCCFLALFFFSPGSLEYNNNNNNNYSNKENNKERKKGKATGTACASLQMLLM